MLVAPEQLTAPTFASILLIGPPFTGKTFSLATLHDVLVARKLPPRIAFFDMDGGVNGGGAETILRLARKGGWINDVELYRYTSPVADRIKPKVEPGRSQQPFLDFLKEFNDLFDRIDPRTGGWQSGKELGAIVVDSVTGLQHIVEDYIFDARHVEIGGEDRAAVTFNHWRLLAEKIAEVWNCARSMPAYFVLTAHVETKQQVIKGPRKDGSSDIATAQTYDVPLIATNMLRDGMAKNFSVVLYSVCENDKYQWITRPSERIRSAGTRGRNGLPGRVNQDFREVLDIG